MAEYGIKQTFPDKVTDFSATAKNGIGVLRWEGAKAYRYIKTHSDLTGDALTAKNLVSFITNATAGTNDFIVTNKSASVTAVAGVAVSAIPESYYGWIQVAGPASCIGSGSVAALECVISATDGTVASCADAVEEQVCGIALEDDIAVTYDVQVMLKGLV